MTDLDVTVDIARPPDVVRRWWTEFPTEYRATDPREQPHRIVTLRRDARVLDLLTYWRGPLGREIEVPETFEMRDDGWDVHIRLPFGLRQKDEFFLTPTPTGTRVRILVTIHAPTLAAKLARPAMMIYARRSYPATWRSAARLCERATMGA